MLLSAMVPDDAVIPILISTRVVWKPKWLSKHVPAVLKGPDAALSWYHKDVMEHTAPHSCQTGKSVSPAVPDFSLKQTNVVSFNS